MILLQLFVLATIGLCGFLLLALYVAYIDKFQAKRPNLEEGIWFDFVVGAGGVTLLIMYGWAVAQVLYLAERMSV